VVQVGGGLVLVAAGWKLLNRSDDDEKASESSAKVPRSSHPSSSLTHRAFYPLTLPLTVGPGSISVAIAVGVNRTPGSEAGRPVAELLGCAVLAITTFLLYRFAEPIGQILGETAMNIVIRLPSFILLCIGVQIVRNGVSAPLRTVMVVK
jgi:multiple antibiotic resistance protein